MVKFADNCNKEYLYPHRYQMKCSWGIMGNFTASCHSWVIIMDINLNIYLHKKSWLLKLENLNPLVKNHSVLLFLSTDEVRISLTPSIIVTLTQNCDACSSVFGDNLSDQYCDPEYLLIEEDTATIWWVHMVDW